MDPIFIAVIVILCQYPLAIFSLLKLFRIGLPRPAMWTWNFVIVLLPFVGAASFWLAYFIKYRKNPAPTVKPEIAEKTAEEATVENFENSEKNEVAENTENLAEIDISENTENE